MRYMASQKPSKLSPQLQAPTLKRKLEEAALQGELARLREAKSQHEEAIKRIHAARRKMCGSYGFSKHSKVFVVCSSDGSVDDHSKALRFIKARLAALKLMGFA
jgi:hypothetical protein